MASFACSASASPKPPYRATYRHQAEGQDSHGEPLFAKSIDRLRSPPGPGGAVRHGAFEPAHLVQLAQAHAIGDADCGGVCCTLPRPWPTTAHVERSKN